MEFTTEVNIPKSSFDITHKDKLLLLGSCFTENIGDYLKNYQFSIHTNPFGIIYHPISIFNSLENIISQKKYTESDLIYHHELFISLEHHGDFSGINKENVLSKINTAIEESHAFFNLSNYIVITLGTSFVYEYIAQHKIVANCHKIPNTAFKKRLLSVDEIVDAFHKLSKNITDKTILFTVSPVRHWRDGASENLRSKSILIESIHQIVEQNSNCFYFPAYEIMMDELRDYRFYTEDMLHPNTVAVKYIWKRFSETYFSEKTAQINQRIEKINLLLQHRIKNENTNAKLEFEQKVAQTIADFKHDFPDINVQF
jgi:hypothetical protein